MKRVSAEENALFNALRKIDLPFDAPMKVLVGLFLEGYLNVVDAETGEAFVPSEFDYLKGRYANPLISREKIAEYFNSRLPESQGQESDICKMCHLIRRANQLKIELFVINKQLNETYGIALTDEFLSRYGQSHISQIPHQDGNKKCCFCTQTGKQPDAQENTSLDCRVAY